MSVPEKSMDAFRQPLPERKLWEKALPWFAALVLAAGVIAAIVKFVPSTSGATDNVKHTQNPVVVSPKSPKRVALDPEARRVAGRFILTAVRRQHLDEAWKLSGPEIRQDLTYKQWLTGNIPVVPFTSPIKVTPMKVDYSYKNQALVEVALIPVKGAKEKTGVFWLELKRVGTGSNARWLVWSWVPEDAPAIPANPVG